MKHQPRQLSARVPRRLRQSMTDAERLLWAIVRRKGIAEYKIRRQHRIGRTVLDFYCAEVGIAIELDGAPHFSEEGHVSDAARDAWLRSKGISVVRFENRDLIANPGILAEAIREILDNARRARLTDSSLPV